MMRLAAAILFFATAPVFSQTAAAPGTTVHRRATTAAKPAASASAASPEANGPGIPVVKGAPKTLYALKYIDLVIGTGEMSVPRKWYTVHYTGWLTNGTKFDSSVDRGQPFTFPYGARRVIGGWDTGFEGMRVGGKRRLIVPYQLAYGEQANDRIPAKSTLIFDVELLGMSDMPPAPPAAPKPPADAAPSGADPLGTAKPATPSTPINPSKPTPPATTDRAPDPAKLPGAPPNGA